MNARSLFATTALVASALPACVDLDRRPGFADVQRNAEERIGKRVAWSQDDDSDSAVQKAVRELLESELTADSASQIALLNNRNLQATYEHLGVAQADLAAAGLLKNPIFEAEFRWPGRPANPWEIHVADDFIIILLIPLRKRVAAAAFEQAKARVSGAILDLDAEVRTTLFRYQSAEQLLEIRKTAAEATQASALIALRQHDAGNISDLDLANERVLHEQARADLALAESESIEQRERLNELMGLWGSNTTRWRANQRMPEPPQADIPLEGLESRAIAQRFDLAAARQEIVSLADTVGLARYEGLIPSINVGGHFERETDGNATWGPSLEIPIPIFDQGQTRIGRAAAELRQSRQRYWALAVQIRSEVRANTSRMLSTRQLVDHYRATLLPLRSDIVEQSQLQYNAMQIGPFQLLQAKQAELDTGRQYIEALRNYWVAVVELEHSVGGRLENGVRTESAVPNAANTSMHEGHRHGEHE